MNLLRPLLFVIGVVLAVAIGVWTFADTSSQQTTAKPQPPTPVDAVLSTKAQEHCWFSVKSRSNIAKVAAGGTALSSAGAGAERMGDLILVTGAIEPAVGDNRFYGCALYEYTEGSPVVVSSTTSSSLPRADALIPPGFARDGKKL
jgi:hypothetical protein